MSLLQQSVIRRTLASAGTVLTICAMAICGDSPLCVELLPAQSTIASNAPTADQLAFFESKIRPVLSTHCYACHGPEEEKIQGGLRLDQRHGWQTGGDSRVPSIVPGEPDKSLLLRALKHDRDVAAMPPDQPPLPAAVIADFSTWISMGAPDPRDQAIEVKRSESWDELFQQRTGWWSLQPVIPAVIPGTSSSDWAQTPVDAFILAKLAAHGLRPQAMADRATLIRRLSFALTGLPPAPELIQSVMQDSSSVAVVDLVEQLLSSPRFGERWARHWLDVVHYSDTHGYEWDAPAKNAYLFRDYVVRAFNSDLPIQQFFMEQIAGDLLEPRVDRELGVVESLIGPMALRLGERRHGDNIDAEGISQEAMANVIDTLGKGFLGLTVACAQCHDHKLDAVPQRDYYALTGVFMSTRWPARTVDSHNKNVAVIDQLRAVKKQIKEELFHVWRNSQSAVVERLRALPIDEKAAKVFPNSLAAMWQRSRTSPLTADEFHAERTRRKLENSKNLTLLVDFAADQPTGTWQWDGLGMQTGLVSHGELAIADEGDIAVSSLLPAGRWSHVWSPRLAGAIRSPLFSGSTPMTFSIQCAGNQHPGYSFIVDAALHSERMKFLNQPQLGWLTQTAGNFASLEGSIDTRQRRVYFEMATKSLNNYFPPRTGYGGVTEAQANDPRSWFGVTRIVQHPAGQGPLEELDAYAILFEQSVDWDVRIAQLVNDSVERWAQGAADAATVQILNEALQLKLLSNSAHQTDRLEALLVSYRQLEQRIVADTTVGSMADWHEAQNERLAIRGSYTELGEEVPRGCLTALGQWQQGQLRDGSGRAELAQLIADPSNPLTARVFVNRVWHHLFGEGLVGTPDDFGHLGETPSHPELLDYLANRFIQEQWSLKKLVRLLVQSSVWQQCSTADLAALEIDPENRWWHHYPLRRLEAEALRDSLLVVSGSHDLRVGGPAVDPYRPAEDSAKRLFSGPIDGLGRRSLYIKMTLMEPPRLLALFNQPIPKLTTGRRDVTSVPDQALAMLNDPFVALVTKHWGQRLSLDDASSPEERLANMFRRALGRQPRPDETTRLLTLAQRSAEVHQTNLMDSAVVWQDVAHALFNLKEFIHVR